MYAEIAAGSPKFKKIFDSRNGFREKENTWFRIAELPFDYFIYAHGQNRP
jgi:TRAP-type mannitol/chloroaromatic compound transport system substrate-binding protein